MQSVFDPNSPSKLEFNFEVGGKTFHSRIFEIFLNFTELNSDPSTALDGASITKETPPKKRKLSDVFNLNDVTAPAKSQASTSAPKNLSTSAFRNLRSDVIVIEDDNSDIPEVNMHSTDIGCQANAPGEVDPEVNYCRSVNLNQILQQRESIATEASTSTLSNSKPVDNLGGTLKWIEID